MFLLRLLQAVLCTFKHTKEKQSSPAPSHDSYSKSKKPQMLQRIYASPKEYGYEQQQCSQTACLR
eukprot:m.23424 g.23424  ORF g.23424 m.23424 type:complete len:65 (+) comp9490_c0_seq3:1677-1871(+)